MAYILGKDLDNWDESVIATAPYGAKESDVKGAQFMKGTDLMRSAKITSEWKDPVAIYAQAYHPAEIRNQITESTLASMVDSVRNLPYNSANTAAQRALEIFEEEKDKPKSLGSRLYEGTEIGQLEKQFSTLIGLGLVLPGAVQEAETLREKAKTYDEVVDLLQDREYPLTKYAQRVIADTTSTVENRRLVRELYNQAHGVDADKWYNQAATIVGAMAPAIIAARLGYRGARMFGAGRNAAVELATNIAKGYIGTEMAGQYAEETAAQYLERTGDKNFENFTAKDASGLSAMAYGAIGAQIEFMGGIEPIIAGSLSKVGLRSGLLAAGAKIAIGEGTEEFLQGITETLLRKMEGSTDKTWKEGLEEAVKGAVWGALMGGTMGTTAFHVNRRNLVKGIKSAFPQITDTQAVQVADTIIDSVAETSTQDAGLRDDLRKKVSMMYETSDIDSKEDRIDAITDLEYALIASDAAWEGIDIADHPIFKGEVNPLGWFRAGVSEEIRPVVDSLLTELSDLQDQLKKLNEAKEKDWEKIDEVERKLEMFDRYVLDRLGENAPASMRAFESELRKVEDRYVAKEKKKAGIKVPADTFETTGKTYTDAEILGMFAKAKNDGSIKLDNWENVRWSSLLSAGDTYQKGKRNKSATEAEKAKFARKMLDKYMPGWNTVETTQQKPMFQEQFDLADENARLDDIYPAYDGETIRIIDPTELKQAQYEVIQRTNPMQDEYHVGIRSVNDIKTFDETIDDKDSFVWGDYSQEDAKRDLAKNEITIYSSKPIENGVFVSTSYRQAQEYAGGKGAKVYKKTVPLDYVAWISGDEGEFAITDVVGKKRSVYNSNGDRIAKSKEALTNFWRWFGDSKVVDEDGRPIVMYHGTYSTFDTFDKTAGHVTDSGFFGSGFYFTPIKSEAEYYGRIVMPVYLKIEKPFIVSTGGYYSGLYDNLFEGGGQLLKDLGLLAENDLKDFNKYERLKKEFLKKVKVEKIYTYDAKHNEVQIWRASFEKNGRSYEANSYRPWEEIGYNEKEDTKENALNNAWGEYAHFNDLNFLIQDLSFTDYIRTNGLAEELSNIIKSRGYDGTIAGDEHVVFEPTQIKSVDNRGTFSSDTGNIYWQNRVSGAAPSTYRGAYIPQFRFIQRANKMDVSTLSHELAHDWFETNFYRYRNEKMSKDFMKAWGALEKALGVTEKDNVPPRKASEAFARAYEAWITSNEDWHKLINVDDKDKDAVAKLMQDYQNSLRDIYNNISNPYFKETWGKLGELKPELKAWFDRVVNITDLDVLVERGEMTEEQATNEKLNRAIDTVIENTTDEETAQTLKEVRTLNDTQRYEVEGGNKNSIQQRLSALAKEIDENNMISKGDKYDTRRDMMQVAEAADNFVKTRLDDALAIINGQMAEVEGLFKEDLYTALERLAIENGDLGLIDELKNSEIANRLAKELGQRVAGFRNFKQSTDLDVVSALKSLDNQFDKALENKKAQKEFNSALDLLDQSLSEQDKIADKELESTLKELECK